MDTFFTNPQNITQKRYETLRALLHDKKPIAEVALQFGYTVSSLYSMVRDFKTQFKNNTAAEYFFVPHTAGRKLNPDNVQITEQIIALRKQYLSVTDIKSILDTKNISISEKQIYNIINKDGFAKLPRRTKTQKEEKAVKLPFQATKTSLLANEKEQFTTCNAGILCLLPLIKSYGIDKLIEESNYPGTTTLPVLNSILAFLALKISNIRRYTADDLWCMDRGIGLFAGVNVLPKAAWYSSYSHSITRKMNIEFLQKMNQLWQKHGLLSETVNLDFVAVPYWGEGDHLEKNWSGTRHQALTSILAVIAHDPDTGIMTYGDTNIRHDNSSDVAVEFLDFYKKSGNADLKYLVFDSKFTTYENLRKLDDNKVMFITIRRRGKKILTDLDNAKASDWKKVTVEAANGKNRSLKVLEQMVFLKDYGKEVRQLSITGNGKIKPALIITNDLELPTKAIIRKYAKRWLVEKNISEQTHFFHLNKVSSSMVIKVDFDLTMTILSHNIYRLLAPDLVGFEHCTPQVLYEKFIRNEGMVSIDDNNVTVSLKKKRNLPALLSSMNKSLPLSIPWISGKTLHVNAASCS